MGFHIEDFDWILKEKNQDFFKKINPMLNIINKEIITFPKKNLKPPIIITGPPRCGSTVVSQIFIEVFDVGHISNFIARFWMAPYIGAYLWKHYNLQREISYNSLRGSTKGLGDLNEFNYFWRRFFDDSHSHYCDKMNKKLKNELRRDIEGITHIFNKSVVFKYVFGSQKIGALKDTIPNMKFLIIKRNPVFITQSILNIRKQVYGTIEKWWGLLPKEIDKLRKLNPYEQIVTQVYYTYKEIERQIKIYPEDIFYVDYENIINNYEDEFNLITKKIKIKKREDYKVPIEKLVISNERFIKENEFEKLKKYLIKYYGEEILINV